MMFLTEEMKGCDLEKMGKTKHYKYDTPQWLLA